MVPNQTTKVNRGREPCITKLTLNRSVVTISGVSDGGGNYTGASNSNIYIIIITVLIIVRINNRPE